MGSDLASFLLLGVASVGTFALSRMLSRRWREKRRQRELQARRAGESRQVRRARERQQQPK